MMNMASPAEAAAPTWAMDPRFKNKFPDATLRRLDKHEEDVTGLRPIPNRFPPER